MADTRDPMDSAPTLSEEQQMLLMALADGELDGDAELRAEAEALLKQHTQLQAAIPGQRELSAALREAALTPPPQFSRASEDALSMVRGRVMTKLPAPTREVSPAPAPSWARGLLSGFSFGRLAFGVSVVLAAVAAVFALRSPQVSDGRPEAPIVAVEGSAGSGAGAAEEPGGQLPAVIIEEMEIDSGTIVVDPSEGEGSPVIIWHLSAEGGAG